MTRVMSAITMNEICEPFITRRAKRHLEKGRTVICMLDSVMVDYYGSKTALSHLGQVSSPEPQLLVIQVFDANAVESVEKALRTSDHGYNPSREGTTLRVSVPPLTEETRKTIVKVMGKTTEDIRISIRNHRRDANEALKKLEKDGEISKDDIKRGLEQVQKQTDSYIAKVDDMLRAKEVEVMEV
ncbi:UNVERIFIED_CONTAM: hypothetical protein GTU68_059409 [Idotea baltica]|nr:hypothetical protein [Idotea baltica]